MPSAAFSLIGLLLMSTGATGHAEVIAQRVVSFTDGPYHWVAVVVPVSAEPTSGTVADVTFFAVVAGSSVRLSDGDGVAQYELDAGEATTMAAGSYAHWTSVADQPGELWQIVLAGGQPTGSTGEVGEAFTPGAGDHDVELIRDVLAPNELVALPDSAAPVLIHAEGAVLVTSDATSTATELGGGQPQTFDGAVTVANLGDVPVAVLVARIANTLGTDVPLDSTGPDGSAVPTDSTAGGGAPVTTSSSASTPTSTATPSTVSTTSSTPTTTSSIPPATPAPGPSDTIDPGSISTTPSSFRDSDSDGLTDAEEVNYGTNPNNADTDGDHLADGYELEIGLNPLVPDSGL
jgi:hypothetical protein